MLNNGQLLIGELKGVTLGKVEFNPDDISSISIKIYKVKTSSATRHIYKMETIHHQIVYTRLNPAAAGYVEINNNNKLQIISLDEIGQLTPLRGNAGALWEANMSACYTYTRSSGIGRFNADLGVGYATRKVEMLGKSSMITTRTDSLMSLKMPTPIYTQVFYSILYGGVSYYLLTNITNNQVNLGWKIVADFSINIQV